jgi:ribonuclease R
MSELEAIGRPLPIRELLRRLDVPRGERRELRGVIRQLITDGEAIKIRGGQIGLAQRMNLVVGRLTCNPGGFGFVAPETRKPGESDVFVPAFKLKDALHGDRVVVRVEHVTSKGPEGRIVRVLERSLQRIVGRFEAEGALGGRVIPFDRRVLHELFVPPGETADAEPGQMVAAEIVRPPTPTRNPIGKVLEVLGRLEEPGVDVKVVMAKYGLVEAFPEGVEREADALSRPVGDTERAGRTDFRNVPTLTIDPATAKDHDDAISLERLPSGRFRLGVHIADVAHYVAVGGELDQEAYLRGTSVYFPGRVVPMLPHALSSGICSLVEGEDRLAQSVLLEVDVDGHIHSTEFHDGVVSCAAGLSYEEAQGIVDGDAALRERFADLVPFLVDLDALAAAMRKRRYARGSLDFDVPEPKLVLGESGEMLAIVATERLNSMRVVEECMLAANEAVARHLVDSGAETLHRVHEAPDPERVEEFCDLVASFGYRIAAREEVMRSEDFQRVLRQIEGKPEEKLVSYLLLRTMKLARYDEASLGHFGLATDRYLHFTSPIRRYPDLVAHRALRALRSAGAPLRSGDLGEMGRHLSERERRATEAERELTEWKKVRFMADKLGDTFSGYVTGVQAFGLFVELEEVFVQGLVHVSSMTDDYYRFDEKAHTLTGESAGRTYRLGDRVEIQVVRVDLERRQIDFGLVEVAEGVAAGGQRRKPRTGRSRPPTRSRRRR